MATPLATPNQPGSDAAAQPDQATLIESLRRPAVFGLGPEAKRIDLLETHISYVLLAGPYAFKIKKAVDALIAADAKRGMKSRLVYLDNAATMKG